MAMMDKMMGFMMGRMSKEDKQKMMEEMMPKMMEGVNMMEMMPKMMGMMGGGEKLLFHFPQHFVTEGEHVPPLFFAH